MCEDEIAVSTMIAEGCPNHDDGECEDTPITPKLVHLTGNRVLAQQVANEELRNGNLVYYWGWPAVFANHEAFERFWRASIDACDEVLVTGAVGSQSQREIAYAELQGKTVRYRWE